MPFLSVITRTFKRPTLLAANQASLVAQTDPDYEQIVLRDEVGIGVAAAQLLLRGVDVAGEYVLVLDDDDCLIDDHLIADLKEIVARAAPNVPDAIVVKMDHGPLGVLPDVWNTREIPLSHIGVSALIVRREVWMRYRTAFAPRYNGDYDYLRAVLQGVEHLAFYDRIVSAVQLISAGQPER